MTCKKPRRILGILLQTGISVCLIGSSKGWEKDLETIISIHNERRDVPEEPTAVIVGTTGAGKSTLLNTFVGEPLTATLNKGKMDIVKTGTNSGQELTFPIGNTLASATSFPRLFPANTEERRKYNYNGHLICDCPGFFDNRSALTDLHNVYLLNPLLTNPKGVKIIFVAPTTFLTERGDMSTKALDHIRKVIGHNVNDSISLVLTKFDPDSFNVDEENDGRQDVLDIFDEDIKEKGPLKGLYLPPERIGLGYKIKKGEVNRADVLRNVDAAIENAPLLKLKANKVEISYEARDLVQTTARGFLASLAPWLKAQTKAAIDAKVSNLDEATLSSLIELAASGDFVSLIHYLSDGDRVRVPCLNDLCNLKMTLQKIDVKSVTTEEGMWIKNLKAFEALEFFLKDFNDNSSFSFRTSWAQDVASSSNKLSELITTRLDNKLQSLATELKAYIDQAAQSANIEILSKWKARNTQPLAAFLYGKQRSTDVQEILNLLSTEPLSDALKESIVALQKDLDQWGSIASPWKKDLASRSWSGWFEQIAEGAEKVLRSASTSISSTFVSWLKAQTKAVVDRKLKEIEEDTSLSSLLKLASSGNFMALIDHLSSTNKTLHPRLEDLQTLQTLLSQLHPTSISKQEWSRQLDALETSASFGNNFSGSFTFTQDWSQDIVKSTTSIPNLIRERLKNRLSRLAENMNDYIQTLLKSGVSVVFDAWANNEHLPLSEFLGARQRSLDPYQLLDVLNKTSLSQSCARSLSSLKNEVQHWGSVFTHWKQSLISQPWADDFERVAINFKSQWDQIISPATIVKESNATGYYRGIIKISDVLTQLDNDPQKTIYVMGWYGVIWDQDVILPGRNLVVISPVLHNKIGTINVNLSGLDGIKHSQLTASHGTNATHKMNATFGANGLAGNSGGHSGNFLGAFLKTTSSNELDQFNLVLDGGRGSNGQNGGNGGAGQSEKRISEEKYFLRKYVRGIDAKYYPNAGEYKSKIEWESETKSNGHAVARGLTFGLVRVPLAHLTLYGNEPTRSAGGGFGGAGGQGGNRGTGDLTIADQQLFFQGKTGSHGNSGKGGNNGPSVETWDMKCYVFMPSGVPIVGTVKEPQYEQFEHWTRSYDAIKNPDPGNQATVFPPLSTLNTDHILEWYKMNQPKYSLNFFPTFPETLRVKK